MEIKRFDCDYRYGYEKVMIERPDGDYVTHADHLAALSGQHARDMEWALKAIAEGAHFGIPESCKILADDYSARIVEAHEKEVGK